MAVPDFERIEGKYEILDKLSEGGMGAVYKVRHRLLDEIRVVKVIRPQLEGDTKLRGRFLREARSAVRLRHPNIATLHDFTIDDDGIAFMVMEFINGEDLKRVVARHERLPVALGLEVGVQTLRALHYLHQQNFIHRDISPDNLMLCRDPEERLLVKLIDLGLAKSVEGSEELTRDGVFIGKFKYGAPEQFGGAGLTVDRRTDLYSLGVALYEVLTGVHPFPGDNEREIVGGHLFRPPRGFDETDADGRLPEGLRQALLRSMEKTPVDRFQSAADFGSALREIQEGWEDPGEDSFIELETTEISAGESADVSTQRRLDYQFAPDLTPPPIAGVKVSPAASGAVTPGPNPGRSKFVVAATFVALAGLVTFLVMRGQESGPAESGVVEVEEPPAAFEPVELEEPLADEPLPEGQPLAEPPLAPPPASEGSAPARGPGAVAAAPPVAPSPSQADRRVAALIDEARAFYRKGQDRQSFERLRAALAVAPRDDAGLRLMGELAASAEDAAVLARQDADAAAAASRAASEYTLAVGAHGSAAAHLAAGRHERAVEGFWSSARLFAQAGRAAEESARAQALTAARAEADRLAAAERAAEEERERESQVATAAPPPAPVDEIPAIQSLINAFARAHRALDIEAVRSLWPSLAGEQLSALTASFEGAREMDMNLSRCDVRTAGARATAHCTLAQTYRPKRGPRQSIARQVTLKLAKVGERWQIEDYS